MQNSTQLWDIPKPSKTNHYEMSTEHGKAVCARQPCDNQGRALQPLHYFLLRSLHYPLGISLWQYWLGQQYRYINDIQGWSPRTWFAFRYSIFTPTVPDTYNFGRKTVTKVEGQGMWFIISFWSLICSEELYFERCRLFSAAMFNKPSIIGIG